jgi:hypothetical protein
MNMNMNMMAANTEVSVQEDYIIKQKNVSLL